MAAKNVDSYIHDNCPWAKLPKQLKELLGNSAKEYEKLIVEYSVRNQLKYKTNIVRYVRSNEEGYYELLLNYSRSHLMLFPYHLSNVIVKGLRVTPFQYYCSMVEDLMIQEKSYDALPNFTAADCLRLLGIGRNQYIDLMNQCRSLKKHSNRKSIKEILPQSPVDITIHSYWIVQTGSILEDDVKNISAEEKAVIDYMIDVGPQTVSAFDTDIIQKLYKRGLIYFDVPVYDNEYTVVPTLDGFVMNRTLGDYLENILYKIFISIDSSTTASELANILQIDLDLVKVW
ncbi:unnamed protein product [Soboliphyme baturini]|uniref:FAM91_N domain-containing protein n=1 Tax=Soboliphyme baturini TaxID=241478 RepID=A0A183IH93_9BILA|nr:unnamed protein product [Soboliphyme baturini]